MGDSERIAVLETMMANLAEIPAKFDKVFDILGDIKEYQSETKPRIKSLEDHRVSAVKNTQYIMDWIGCAKGSIMTLKYIYPVVQVLLIGVVMYFK